MTKRLGILLLALLAMLAIACGGVTHTHTGSLAVTTTTTTTTTTATTATTATTTTVVAPAPAPSLRCPAGDITMQCQLAKLPPPSTKLRLAPGQTYGIDFGWSAVSALGAKSIGAKFGASYLSLDPTKNWTRPLVDSYHAAGLKTVAVWETSADRTSTEGAGSDGTFAAGQSDARAARAQATALAMPTNRVIEFGEDCDCAPSSTAAYFQGVDSVLGVAATGDYGGYDQVLWLSQHHLVGAENWQTYAWSGGRRLPCSIAPLYQYLNGDAFDNDSSCAPLYGQWPAKVAPPPNPHRYLWAPPTRRTFHVRAGTTKACKFEPTASDCVAVRARMRLAMQQWDREKCQQPTKAGKLPSSKSRPCFVLGQHMQLFDGRFVRIAHHTPNLKHKVKRPRWGAVAFKAKDGHKATLGGLHQQLIRRDEPKAKNHGVVSSW